MIDTRPPPSDAAPARPGLLALIRSDLAAMIVRRTPNPAVHLASAALKVLLYPRIQAVILFRLGHAALRLRLSPLAYACQSLGLTIAGAEIHPAAEIGPGLCLVHSSGIVIGDRVVIGPGFQCFHGVTIGDAGTAPGQPVLGRGVVVYAGAKVLGPIRVGDRARVGANAVLLVDVPDDGVAVGVPARVRPPAAPPANG